MNVEAINELIEHNPKLATAREKLEEMQPGRYCIHQSWGFGLIKEYRPEDNRLIIDFEDKKEHSMDPAFCVNTMTVLPEDHLLARQQTEPEVIDELLSKQPVEAVIQALANYPNHAATGQELENLFRDLLGANRFRRWWNNTKKQLALDPRVHVPLKKTECFFVREEPLEPEEEIFERFNDTQSAKRKIMLVEELLKSETLVERWSEPAKEMLENFTETVRDSHQLNLSERLHGAWVRNDLARALGVDVEGLEPSTGSLIADEHDLAIITDEIAVGQQRRFLELIKNSHPGEWKEIVFSLLKESKGRFTTESINFLIEYASEEALIKTFNRWLSEQNLRAPVLHWIVKNRNTKKFGPLLEELISPRLLNAIFYAIDYEALETAGTRKIPLAEALSDDADLIPDLLKEADDEIARDLANNLLLNQGFEELAKKSILARFIKQFPNVQSLLDGEAEVREERLIVSQESYDQRKKEYEELVSKKIPEISKAIGIAREHGDLKENSEYKMAKQEQAVLLARQEMLEKDLSRAQITNFADAPTEQIGIGSVAGLRIGSSNQLVTYTILGAWDSDPDNNILSYETPLAKGLLGKRVGESVTLNISGNEETWTVESIDRYVK